MHAALVLRLMSTPAVVTVALSGPTGIVRASTAPTFATPGFISVDAQGNLYVSDITLGDLVKLSPSGKLLARFTGFSIGDFTVTVSRPGIGSSVVASNGDIFVSDARTDRIKELARTGRTLARWGGTGTRPGKFRGVWYMALDRHGRLYVSDFYNFRIQVFNTSGKLLRILAANKIDGPAGLAVDRQGNLLVVGHRAGYVTKFSPSGKVLAEWLNLLNPDSIMEFAGGIAIVRDGTAYVVDSGHRRITRWSPAGKYLGTFALQVVVDPEDIAIDSHDHVWVAELTTDVDEPQGIHRIQEFTRDGRLLQTLEGA